MRVRFPHESPYIPLVQRQNNGLQNRGLKFESSVGCHADVAQLAERLFCKQRVEGSSPFVSSTRSSRLKGQDTGLSIRRCEFESREDHHHALLTQWAEYSSDTRAVRGSSPRWRTIQPFRLTGRTSDFDSGGVGSNPVEAANMVK